MDALDQDPVDPVLLAEFMYSHIEQAAEGAADVRLRPAARTRHVLLGVQLTLAGVRSVDLGDSGYVTTTEDRPQRAPSRHRNAHANPERVDGRWLAARTPEPPKSAGRSGDPLR